MDRLRYLAIALSTIAVLLSGAGCTDATVATVGTTPDGGTTDAGIINTPVDQLTVDSGVSDDSPLAGSSITVFCTVEGLAQGQEAPETVWQIIATPDPIAHQPEITGDEVVFKTSGSYRIQCSIVETGWADPTPVVVNVEPGPPSGVETTVSPSEIAAGSTGTVICEAQDSYGNEIVDGWEVIVGPGGSTPGEPGGLVAAGLKVKGLVIGTYDVACRQQFGLSDDTPAVVTVVHGLPHTIVTTLDEEEIEAGGQTKVTCTAEDKQGNSVLDLPMTVSLPDVLSLTGLFVGSTIAGTYVIRCVPAGLDWSAFKLEHAVLEVVPGPPLTLELALAPPKPYFNKQELVTVVAIVHDSYGNMVPEAEIEEFLVAPDTDYTATTLKTFLFKEEGTFTLSTALVSDPTIAGSIDVLINGEPPAVTVTYPLRGATILGTKPSITVEGLAFDAVAGIVDVRINGKSAVLDEAEGTFSGIFIPVWGLNILEIEAEDASGSITKITQSFYFSDRWYSMQPQIQLMPDVLKLWMSEDFIDDGVHNPTHPDDLATILEGVLKDFDLSGALGGESEIGLGYSLILKEIGFNPPKLQLDPQYGGLAVDVEIKNLYIKMKLEGECKVLGVDLCPDFSGKVIVDKTLISATLLAAAANGNMDVSLTDPKVDMDHIDLDIDGILGWLFDWLIDFIVYIFSGTIEDLVEDQLADSLGDTLVDLFSSLAINETIAMNGLFPGQPDIILTLDTVIWTLAFTPKGGSIGMAGRMIGANNSPHTTLGSIGRGTCLKGYPTAYALPGDFEFEVGLHDDLLNELLAAVWRSGALNMILDEAALGGSDGGFDLDGLPIDSLILTTDFYLPPILNGCGEDGLVKLQLGDFFIDIEIDSFIFGGVGKIGLFMYLDVNAEIYLTENEEGTAVGLILHDIETLKFHWAYVPDNFVGNEQLLEDLITTQLIDPLLDDLIGSPLTEFQIPSFDMGDLGGAGTDGLTIVPQIDQLLRDNGHTVLKGQLE